MTTETAGALSAGKLRGLLRLADSDGIFRMIAVDQRPPIFRALARHGNRNPEDVTYEEVAQVKALLTRVLAPEAGAILIDPIWTHPHALLHIPGSVGLLSTLEDYRFTLHDGERRSHPIAGWSVAKIKRSGADGVKVLVWHRPDVSPETQAHQDQFVLSVGEACRREDIPFVLELLIYPKPGDVEDSLDYARARPQRVIESVRHYSDDRFGVDLLKLEFPADLKYCAEYASGAFDGKPRQAAYDLSEVKGFLAELAAVTNVPWVLLSAGVTPHEFALNLELACEAGASGFLAGRAVWLDALDHYPDLDAIEARLITHALPYLRVISALAERGLPWSEHRRFEGEPKLLGASAEWVFRYGEVNDG